MNDWRAVVGFEGSYEVSSDGQVRSLTRIISDGRRITGRTMKHCAGTHGHPQLLLSRNGKRYQRYVHRLVLEAFVGPCPEALEACHWNGNPADNRIDNLRWDTRSANGIDAVRHGRHRNNFRVFRGEEHGSSKLTNVDIERMRDLSVAGLGPSRIGKWLGIHSSTIQNVLKGRNWKHV